MSNDYFPFLGGNFEAVPAGSADIPDEQTGAIRHFDWPNYIRVSTRLGKGKLTRHAIEAIVELYAENTEFRAWVDRCQ